MNIDEIRKNAPDGATHTNGKSYYMHEQIYDGDKGEWYRWVVSKKIWSEVLNKPRNIEPL